MSVIAFVLILVFAAASFFFALAEASLFSLSPWQTRALAEENSVRGRRVARLLASPEDLLATIVLGNTTANAMIVGLGVWLSLRGHLPAWGAIPGLLFVLLVVCEVMPKTLAVRLPEPWALRVARPMWGLVRLSRPVRRIAQKANAAILGWTVLKKVQPLKDLTEEEYQELIELACQQGTLAPSEKEIILQIIQLDRRTAKEVMRSRSQMACISDDLTQEEMVAASRKYRHRRLPIYDETPDTIVGILNTRVLLLNPDVDLAEAIEFPSFVPDSMNLLQLLVSLQKQQRGLAIVLDEFGGTAGLVTIEDILEEVIGEIRSETEESGFVMERLEEGRWRVNGTMRLEDFRREYPELGEYPEVDTLGGLFVALMEIVPKPGESTVFRGLRLTALAGDDRRVRELRVERIKKRGGN
ncbi:MAG TPA: hemolysin family protein [Candidatus Paceibacterota bacterium]|nr:hemolysin family protein [Verrucomicrobiota bacterium]HRY49938.1 hemolysin family protein [Candidatus Paceibacterota bacterium]